jgi:hypothetical protein
MIKRLSKSLSAGWIFLLGVLIIYLALGILSFPIIENALLTFLKLIERLLPILAVVFGLMFFSNLFLHTKRVSSYLGKESGLKGWLIVILGGILSTGPIYM